MSARGSPGLQSSAPGVRGDKSCQTRMRFRVPHSLRFPQRQPEPRQVAFQTGRGANPTQGPSGRISDYFLGNFKSSPICLSAPSGAWDSGQDTDLGEPWAPEAALLLGRGALREVTFLF